ncbi:MAG: HlyD family efflux transporter periplasmic adaptor subunit [Saprospirales bacterium]|nr:MAG: HlyD family efflux transporter periplasmic adaptor subunit [Saprospirales bacterium]
MNKKKSSRKWLWILLGVIVILVVIALLKKGDRGSGIDVQVEKVEDRTIVERVTASGKIFPEREVKISSDVSGEIVELNVAEGDSVQQGQVLVRINPDTYLSAVERGRANLNNARAQRAVAMASVETARAQKMQIEAQYNNAKRMHERNTRLFNDDVISEAEFENSLATYESANANLESAKASISSSEQNVKAAEYTIKGAQASLSELQTSLQRTTIMAPVNGIVSRLNVELGERVVGTIQMAGTEMMRVANFSTMEVQVEVSENDILKVSLGDSVEIEVDAYLDRTFYGRVTEIANSAANVMQVGGSLASDQVTNFIVKARINPSSYEDLIVPGRLFPLRPGMSAAVDIITDIQKDITSLPIQAVTTREDEDSGDFNEVVFLYKEGVAEMTKVKTGIQDDRFIQIREGLEVDQEVITGPFSAVARRLNDGDDVNKTESRTSRGED